MKIAYLILAHTHPLHLARLISALQTEHAHIFLHIDTKTDAMICPAVKGNLTVIKNTVTVNWGGFSVVQATLNLLKEAATSGEYDYFLLLSGADYPLRSNAYILRFLQRYEGKEFLNLYKMPEMNKTFDRIVYFYIEPVHHFAHSSLSKGINALIEKANKLLRSPHLKRRYPQQYAHFTLYAGSQWWALSKPCVDYILQFITQNPGYVKFYKHARIPDSTFFHTIIGNSPFKKNVVGAVMSANWLKGSRLHPATITLEDLPRYAQKMVSAANGNGEQRPLFARKFTDDSQEVITEIERLFRNDD
ncbi:MAG TPA: beta-1,6-N-acetylglucosaminyltransferase [Ktedonobacteraceae bacterium]|nr:beta-1,6-N-acetylglucosaminyltransferase [Ktedonobacteraceae bacterium]